MPTINLDTVCYIIVKAREFDEQVRPDVPDPGSNPSDDRGVEVLEGYADDPTLQELTAALEGLNEDEIEELLALVWIGRGDFGKDEWDQAVAQARAARSGTTVRYLIGTPLLGDLIEEALGQFGLSCDDLAKSRL